MSTAKYPDQREGTFEYPGTTSDTERIKRTHAANQLHWFSRHEVGLLLDRIVELERFARPWLDAKGVYHRHDGIDFPSSDACPYCQIQSVVDERDRLREAINEAPCPHVVSGCPKAWDVLAECTCWKRKALEKGE